MTPKHKAVLESIPLDDWVTDSQIAEMVKTCTVRNLRSYILPTLCKLDFVERRRGINGHLPSCYRRRQLEFKPSFIPQVQPTITDRKCLTCSGKFKPESRHNYICFRCSGVNKRIKDW